MPAYACRISEENLPAIRSEHPRFDLEEFRAWAAQHEDGYFLRDPDSCFDCKYFEATVFAEMYKFEEGDFDPLFRKVQRL